MFLKKILIIILVALLNAATASAVQNQQIEQKLAHLAGIRGKFTFAVLGDNRSGDNIYRKLVSMVMERKPAFIVNTGDVIEKPGDLQQWAKFWEMSRPVTVPYFLTVGNHDAHPQVKSSEKTWKEQVDLPGNELYYSFAAGNSLFVVLDSFIAEQEKKITAEQYAWLEKLLAGSKRKHTFVFVHHPLYPQPGKGRHHGNSLDRYTEDRDGLQALFRKHSVTAVFMGHEHVYLRKNVDGVAHVITGGAGAPLYGLEEFGGFHHYVFVAVDEEKVTAEVVDINGKVRDRY